MLFVVIFRGGTGLVNLVVLPLFDTNMPMRHKRLLIGLMVLAFLCFYYEFVLFGNIWWVKLLILYMFLIAGRVVDGREIAVQFAKYGPNAEKM